MKQLLSSLAELFEPKDKPDDDKTYSWKHIFSIIIPITIILLILIPFL
jgi:hypothetical protein